MTPLGADDEKEARNSRGGAARTGLFLGALGAALAIGWSLAPAWGRPASLPPDALRTLGVAWLMAVFWVTEAIPIPATSLIPLAAFPLMGILRPAEVAGAYGDRFILLLLTGFLVALAIEAHGLHRRLALGLVSRIGVSPGGILASFMLAGALLSMFISNTATTLMMLPIAQAVVAQATAGTSDRAAANRFATALFLGVAYASNIGGIGTPIGTPPNLILMGVHARSFPDAEPVSFARWLAWGVPFVAVFTPIAGVYLYRWIARPPRGFAVADRALLNDMRSALGPMRPAERRVLAVFVLTAVLWITRQGADLGAGLRIPGWSQLVGLGDYVDDSTVATLGALLMFLLPAGDPERPRRRLLDWSIAPKVPWGLLLLFGGGIALARAFERSGLSEVIGSALGGLHGLPFVVILFFIAISVSFLTEITSNTATTTLLMPILAAAAVAADLDPLLLMVPAAMSASCAFMLPVATAPNAIVFGTGSIPMKTMARTGVVLNVIGAFVTTAIVSLILV